MPLHKQGQELRSEQTVTPLHEQNPSTYFLRLNNSETFIELVGARPLHLLSQTALLLKSPTGAFEWQHGLRSKWRSLTPTSARPCDRTFSSIENLWPQVDTCFRPFRATLKISEVEPQCTLKILQSKTFEKAKPLLMVTVHTERSSCPCFAAALSGSPTESVRSWRSISFRRLMKNSRYSMKKAGRSADTTTCFFQAQE